jgi:hypothetical protein
MGENSIATSDYRRVFLDISAREIIMIHRDSEKVPETGFCGSFSTAFSDLLPSGSH